MKSTKIQIGFALFVEEFVTVVFAGMQKDGHPLGISIERLIPLISCPYKSFLLFSYCSSTTLICAGLFFVFLKVHLMFSACSILSFIIAKRNAISNRCTISCAWHHIWFMVMSITFCNEYYLCAWQQKKYEANARCSGLL